jgi:hypothetical protein
VKKVGAGRGFVVAVFRPHAELSTQSICKLHLMGICQVGLMLGGSAPTSHAALSLLNKF